MDFAVLVVLITSSNILHQIAGSDVLTEKYVRQIIIRYTKRSLFFEDLTGGHQCERAHMKKITFLRRKKRFPANWTSGRSRWLIKRIRSTMIRRFWCRYKRELHPLGSVRAYLLCFWDSSHVTGRKTGWMFSEHGFKVSRLTFGIIFM